MWQDLLLNIWGCIPELSKDCQDMTNASSTYLGILAGAIVGGIISWWIYDRQKKTTEKQDLTLTRIKELNERHDRMLKRLEESEMRHDRMLKRLEESEMRHDSTMNAILELNKKIEHIIERQDKLHESIQTGRASRYRNNGTTTETYDSKE